MSLHSESTKFPQSIAFIVYLLTFLAGQPLLAPGDFQMQQPSSEIRKTTKFENFESCLNGSERL